MSDDDPTKQTSPIASPVAVSHPACRVTTITFVLIVSFWFARHTTRVALLSRRLRYLYLPPFSPNVTMLLSRGNSRMRSSMGPLLPLMQRYRSMR